MPPACCLGILHNVLYDLNAPVPGRLKPEGRLPAWKRDVIVDGLRHMDNAHRAPSFSLDPVRHEEGPLSAYGDKVFDSALLQRRHQDLELVLDLVGIVAGCP